MPSPPSDERSRLQTQPTEAGGSTRPHGLELHPEGRKTIKAVERGSITEAVGGAAGVVLAIVGIAGVAPRFLGSIATIVIGIAFIAQATSVAGHWSRFSKGPRV